MILGRFLSDWLRRGKSSAAPEVRAGAALVERLPGYHCLVRGRHGLFIANVNDLYVGRSLIHYGEYSESEAALLHRACESGSSVVEVGANIGAHTIGLAKAVGPGGKVFAIEPQPELFRLLCANVALNCLNNVLPLNCGCGESQEELRIPDYDFSQEANFASTRLRGHDPSRATVRVQVETLDAVVSTREKISLIKIDVEGMEAEVLRGGMRLVESHRPVLYVENDRPEKSAELIDLIRELGYRMWWHSPLLFNSENYFANGDNLFPATASRNMLCVHRSAPPEIARGLKEVARAR